MNSFLKIPLYSLLLIHFIHAQTRIIPIDTVVITQHNVVIKGQKISYTATTGTQPVWDALGEPVATLYYTYYKNTGHKDMSRRPLIISFNGGPGSASVWMHLAYTGPKLLNIDDEGFPIQPYGIRDNTHSILDVADIVYVNPVNTGYSRTIPQSGHDVDKKKYFGINADIKYLAEWINTFITRYDRWLSPKYLIGESYGGTRVSGLALELQEKHWIYLNGVILVSPADYKVFESDSPISSAIHLPYFTAAAWYHKALISSLQQRDLLEILPLAEKFTLDTLMPAMARGSSLSAKQRQDVAQRMAFYSGLSEKDILQYNLIVPTAFFWKALLRDKTGNTLGRLDSRYLGIDKTLAGNRPDYSPELTSWLHAFTPAINYYIRTNLQFVTDVKYNMFGHVYPWDKRNNRTRDQLRRAMAQNPYLQVMFQSGYYDGATTYFNSKYTMWQIDPSGRLKERLRFKGYRSGHMMYLRKQDLVKATDDIRDFIHDSTVFGKAAKY